MAKLARRYLSLRGTKWWFKRDIPAAIRPKFGGNTAYLVNLQTSDLRKAQERRDRIAAETNRLFKDAREGKAPAPDASLAADAEFWAGADPEVREEYDAAFDAAVERLRQHDEEHGTAYAERVFGRWPIEDPLEAHLSEVNLRQKTIQERRAAVLEFAEWARKKRLSAVSIGRRQAAEYFEATILPRSRKTAAKRLSNLKRYWDWLIERGRVEDANPWEGLRLPREQRGRGAAKEMAERAFTEAEMRKLFTAAPPARMRDLPRLYDAMRVAAMSGMRIEEICQLTVDDCAEGVFNIREGKTENSVRRVPIHSSLAELIAMRSKGKRGKERIFSDVNGRGESVSDPLSKQFGRFIREIGVADLREGHRRSKVNFHSFRRWFVDSSIQAGQPPHIVSWVVGHAEGRKGMTLGTYNRAGPSSDQLRTCVEAVRLPDGVS